MVCGHILGLSWHILGAMLPQLEVMSAHVGAMLAHLGAMLAHLGAMRWLGVVCAGRFGVGRSWLVLAGMELVGWGRAHRNRFRVLCASGVGVGRSGCVLSGLAFVQAGLGLAGRGVCCRVWGLCFRVGRSVLGGDGL